jgi:hypothetical protein
MLQPPHDFTLAKFIDFARAKARARFFPQANWGMLDQEAECSNPLS